MKNSSLFRSFLLSKSVATHKLWAIMLLATWAKVKIPKYKSAGEEFIILILSLLLHLIIFISLGGEVVELLLHLVDLPLQVGNLVDKHGERSSYFRKTNSDHSDQASLPACLPPRKNHTYYTAIHYIGPTGPWAIKLIWKPKQHHLINLLRYYYCRAPPWQHNPLLAEFASDPGNICLKLCWVFAPFAHTPEVPL